MPTSRRRLFTAFSFLLAAFGQPAWVPFLGIFAALFGYALFWRAMLSLPRKKQRFQLASAWFFGVQLIQLSWLLSHPFYYIYAVWILFSAVVALQFGLLSLLFNPQKFTRPSRMLLIAACWTLFEWSRLFFLSGYSWNPVGLALAGNTITLQAASVGGVYGLSFLVILLNLAALRAWRYKFSAEAVSAYAVSALAPFLFGGAVYAYHSYQIAEWEEDPSMQYSALLIQPSFPVEESLHFTNSDELFAYVMEEWEQLLGIAGRQYGKPVDLVALPELVVPFGTYTFVYSKEEVEHLFESAFGSGALEKLPAPELPYAFHAETESGKRWLVNNAYFGQALANLFDASVVIGLEDVEDVNGKLEYYSSAVHFIPDSRKEEGYYQAERYAKRILVPMGEYIPFSLFRDIAARYGVFGSFTCGKSAQVWDSGKGRFGLSICYEEMFGDMMRENRRMDADFLLNITNDAWFPRSRLIRQHVEHSRLRTVENGFPLLRSCNTGITCAIDSLGRDVAVLGDSDASREELSDALFVTLPLYNYQTLYSRFGDGLVLGFSLLCCLLFLRYRA